MTDEAKTEEVGEKAQVSSSQEGATASARSQQLTPKQIFDAYPNDKEKARDYLLLGMQADLNRIANVLEYFASKDVAAEKAKKVPPAKE